MSKDFHGAVVQAKSCTLNQLKNLTEYESLESRLEHSQHATIYNITVLDGRCSAVEGKLRTCLCCCHQAVELHANRLAVMLRGWEGNPLPLHWPCVTDLISGVTTFELKAYEKVMSIWTPSLRCNGVRDPLPQYTKCTRLFIISGPLCWNWYSSTNKRYFGAEILVFVVLIIRHTICSEMTFTVRSLPCKYCMSALCVHGTNLTHLHACVKAKGSYFEHHLP